MSALSGLSTTGQSASQQGISPAATNRAFASGRARIAVVAVAVRQKGADQSNSSSVSTTTTSTGFQPGGYATRTRGIDKPTRSFSVARMWLHNYLGDGTGFGSMPASLYPVLIALRPGRAFGPEAAANRRAEGYSRKAVRLLIQSSSQIWAELHERALAAWAAEGCQARQLQ